MLPDRKSPRASSAPSRYGAALGRARLSCAVALVAILSTTAARGEAHETYRLAPGDRLTVEARRFPDVATQPMIGLGGEIRLMGAGAIAVAGLTLDEARRAVAAALAEAIGIEPSSVHLDVVEYRPVVVHGDGRRGATIPFRPGLTVMHAVAATSALGVEFDGSLIEALEASRAPTRVADAADRLATALASRERLNATLDNRPYQPRPFEGVPVSEERGAQIDASEISVLALDKRRFEQQQSNLEAQAEVIRRQLDSLETEFSLQRQREALSTDDLARLEELGQQGLTTMLRLSQARADQLNAQLLVVRILADKAGAENEFALVRSAISDNANQRRLGLAAELRQVDTEVAAARKAFAQARREAAIGAEALAGLGAPLEFDGAQEFRIMRQSPAGAGVERVAEPEDLLMPGDVVRIVAPSSRRGASRAAQAQ